MQNMKTLVTGATGFVGSNLVEELISQGFEVRVLVRKTSKLDHLSGLKIEICYGDINDFDSVCQAVRGVDYVFHVAGVIFPRSRSDFFRINEEGARNVIRAAAQENSGIKRFVLISSMAAGGPVDSLNPRTESQPDQPVSDYGRSKLAAESALLPFCSKVPISIVRPPIIYGPRDSGVLTLVKMVASRLMIFVKGNSPDGKKYYSMIHVKDLCRGLIQVAVAKSDQVKSGEIFYLSGDDYASFESWLDEMASCLDRKPFKIYISPRVVVFFGKILNFLGMNVDKLNEILPDYWICSNEKARRLLNFKPEYDLRRGTADAIQWYKKNQWIR